MFIGWKVIASERAGGDSRWLSGLCPAGASDYGGLEKEAQLCSIQDISNVSLMLEIYFVLIISSVHVRLFKTWTYELKLVIYTFPTNAADKWANLNSTLRSHFGNRPIAFIRYNLRSALYNNRADFRQQSYWSRRKVNWSVFLISKRQLLTYWIQNIYSFEKLQTGTKYDRLYLRWSHNLAYLLCLITLSLLIRD